MVHANLIPLLPEPLVKRPAGPDTAPFIPFIWEKVMCSPFAPFHERGCVLPLDKGAYAQDTKPRPDPEKSEAAPGLFN